MFSSIANGLRAAAKQPKLVALIWGGYFLLSLVPALPGLAWLRTSLDVTPAAAEALTRFDFGLLGDLLNYDRTNVFSLLLTTMMAAAIVALVASAFVMGGILEVLGGSGGEGDRRTFMHRFARGGGHFFWRFVRLTLMAGSCAALATGLVAGLVGAITTPMGESEWEPGGFLASLILAMALAGTAALFLLPLDYARIRVARDDSRKMLRAYVGGLGFVLRHLAGAYGIALAIIAGLAGVMLLYVAYETTSPVASTGALIAMLFAFQQITVVARVYLRVAMIGAERAYFAKVAPAAIAPATVDRPPVPVAEPPAAEQPAATDEARQ